MKKLISSICFLLSFQVLINAQCLMAFKDTRQVSDRFYIFDNGKIIQQEYKVTSFSSGRSMIAYVDNSSKFKVYKDGQTETLQNIASTGYFAGDDFVFYGGKIFDGSKTYERCELSWNDELSLLEDTTEYLEKQSVYLNQNCIDDISEIYDRLYGDTVHVRYFRGGDYYFIRGKKFIVLESEPESYETNKIVAAFVDVYGEFKAFYNGEIFPLDDFGPLFYKTGEDFVAYQSSIDDSFKAFYNGKVYSLLPHAPKSYSIKKDLLVYFDLSDHLHIFYKGINAMLANYRPEEIKTDRGILVFKDLDNRLQGFIDGKQQKISEESVSDFIVKNKAVMFYKIPTSVQIFCNGKIIKVY